MCEISVRCGPVCPTGRSVQRISAVPQLAPSQRAYCRSKVTCLGVPLRQAGHYYAFGFYVVVERFGAVFTADARGFDPAERQLVVAVVQ